MINICQICTITSLSTPFTEHFGIHLCTKCYSQLFDEPVYTSKNKDPFYGTPKYKRMRIEDLRYSVIDGKWAKEFIHLWDQK